MGDSFNADFLVLGGGMAGMTAAAYASEQGAVALVVEKAATIGGSAIISGGGLWTAASYEILRETNPLGEASKAKALVEGFDEVGDFIAGTGADIAAKEIYSGTQSFPGVVRRFDVADYMGKCESAVRNTGGAVVVESMATSLRLDNGRVTGGRIASLDGEVDVCAPWTMLATGGFQNNRSLRAKYLGPNGADLAVRSNAQSDGAGLTLGVDAGAATSAYMSGWYGHTVSYPIYLPMDPKDYIPYAQFFLSPRGVLLDCDGRRFVDESKGYYLNAQAVSQLPDARALLIVDESLRAEDEEKFGVDRIAFARRRGANVATANGLAELDNLTAQWGFMGVAAGIAAYNDAIQNGAEATPAREQNRRAVVQPPFYAMQIQPAVTFTHGGLRTDAHAKVISRSGEAIPGLLAAGADAGGLYHMAYAGGLAMAGVSGLAAAKTVLGNE